MSPQVEVPSVYDDVADNRNEEKNDHTPEKRQYEPAWVNIIFVLIFTHTSGLYGAYLFITEALWITRLFAVLIYYSSGLGITAGAHRLWAHKSYKARWPLQIILIFLNSMAFQRSVLNWSRDHRMHHKYSETDADPHNATRGFFFSHFGWLLVKKHPEIRVKGKTLYMRDLEANTFLVFQHKYYAILVLSACVIIPTYVPTYWNETLWNSFFICFAFRYMAQLHVTFLVNSVAHLWGNKPYDRRIKPGEVPIVSFLANGEGYHNYHHTFPFDYKTGELGNAFNFTKLFIDVMAKIGWAYDMRTVSKETIEKHIMRTGDGSHTIWKKNKNGGQK